MWSWFPTVEIRIVTETDVSFAIYRHFQFFHWKRRAKYLFLLTDIAIFSKANLRCYAV